MKRTIGILVLVSVFILAIACGREPAEDKSDIVNDIIGGVAVEPADKVNENKDTAEGMTAEETGASDNDVERSGDLVFTTVDIYGNPVTEEIIKGSRLVMMNLWEPWCGPCVREMPDLETLYEKYKDQGLIILGVYTTFDMDDDAMSVIESCGITYPILKADRNLYAFEQSYVPATFLFDGEGNLLEKEPVAGSQTYKKWESIILKYLD